MQKNVLITGCSRGLGQQLAARCADAGCLVFACARDTASAGVLSLAAEYGPLIVPVALDVADRASVDAAAAAVAEVADGLDLVINDAGVHGQRLPFVNTDIEQFPDVLNVNVLGPMRVVQAMIHLLRARHGAVLNISSEAGSITNCDFHDESAYRVSKCALNMATKIMSNAFRAEGVSVYAVHPGWLRTDMGGSKSPNDPYVFAGRILQSLEAKLAERNETLYFDPDGTALPW